MRVRGVLDLRESPVEKMENSRAPYFTDPEQQLLMELYEEFKHIVQKNANTSPVKTVFKYQNKAGLVINRN